MSYLPKNKDYFTSIVQIMMNLKTAETNFDEKYILIKKLIIQPSYFRDFSYFPKIFNDNVANAFEAKNVLRIIEFKKKYLFLFTGTVNLTLKLFKIN